MSFTLSKSLNNKKLKRQYGVDKRVQIPAVMPEQQTTTVYKALSEEVMFDRATVLNNEVKLLPASHVKGMPQNEYQAMIGHVYSNAARGVGFWYERASDAQMSIPVIQDFQEWLTSAATLKFVRELTEIKNLTGAIMQTTCFRPGDFLTRHRDLGVEASRRVAFVFHVSPEWHPDWGGLLQFYRQEGKPRDA